LPIRLNVDQDTLEFLQDFSAVLVRHIAAVNRVDNSNLDDQPVMQVATNVLPTVRDSPVSPSQMEMPHSSPPSELGDLNDLMPQLASSPLSHHRELETAIADARLTMSAVSVGSNFFAEKDPRMDSPDDEDEESSIQFVNKRPEIVLNTSNPEIVLNTSNASITFRMRMDGDQGVDQGHDQGHEQGSTSTIDVNQVNSSSTLNRTPPSSTTDLAIAVASRREIFFKEFSFSPAVTIRLDYVGKRVKADQGAVLGLLIGLSSLHCTQLSLKELHNQNGLLGTTRCIQYALNEWGSDIRANQLPQVIGSFGPITSVVQLARGVRDLLLMPVDEYRKQDGHVVKGLQRGAESFGISTAAAFVDMAQRCVSLVQGVAEMAFDIVTPDYPLPASRRHLAIANSARTPNDLREGLHMAYDTVCEGVSDTAQVLQAAAVDDRAGGHWPLRGLLRQATPTVLRPIVVASRATGQLLSGLSSQLQPDSRREERDKWRPR